MAETDMNVDAHFPPNEVAVFSGGCSDHEAFFYSYLSVG